MPDAPLRVAIVDDEPPARRKLVNWLSSDPDLTICAVCADGYEAIEAVETQAVDVLFLDIQMPELSGFDVLNRLPAARRPMVVFATAFDHYAIDAFQHHAVDYLLKPYDRARFADALAHIKRQHRQRTAADVQQQLTALLESVDRSPPPPLTYFTVKQADEIQLVDVETVDWIEADGNYVILHVGPKRHVVRSTITRVAGRLDAQRFARIHRSAIVRLGAVRAFYPASHG
ncbi:MAG: response regulator transcription factor, partial [Bacteroidota bacterium]